LEAGADPAQLAALIERLALGVKPWEGENTHNSVHEKKLNVKRHTVAEQLVGIAMTQYRFGRSDRDELFAVARDGPNLANMLKGGNDALRARLARQYRQETRRTPGASALADALNVLAGEALEADSESVHLRSATHERGVVIDLGRVDGKAVFVRPGSYEIIERSPVLFIRTALSGALPIPERGGTLAELRELLNVSDESWPLVLGWLMAAQLPEIPHPVLLLSGLQCTGKSCVARTLLSLFDPSPAPLRSEPRDLDRWQIAASGSWAVGIDNLSSIPPWFSDAICRAATGDGLIKRKLYTDGELVVLAFRRVVLLTSIDPGVLRDDLGDRLLMVDLEPIPEASRRTEREMDCLFGQHRARILGALLDALAAILTELPKVRPGHLPRMADFGRVLAAADAAGVTDGALDRFRGQRGRIAAEVIDGDPFALAVVELAHDRRNWQGTATELLAALLPEAGARLPKGWPPRNGVAGRLKRLIPVLANEGVYVEIATSRTKRGRIITLESRLEGSSPSSRSSTAWPDPSRKGDDG
jgi:hypothetical protein